MTTERKSDRNISLQLFDSTSQRRLQRPQLSQKHTIIIKSSARNDHRPPWHKLKDDNATDAQLQQWRRDPAWPTRFWCDVWDQWCVFCTPSLAVYSTRCSPPDLNLVNLEATIAAKWTLAFLFLLVKTAFWWRRTYVIITWCSARSDDTFIIFFSYLKCQDELCQKLWKCVELCQSYAWNTIGSFFSRTRCSIM